MKEAKNRGVAPAVSNAHRVDTSGRSSLLTSLRTEAQISIFLSFFIGLAKLFYICCKLKKKKKKKKQIRFEIIMKMDFKINVGFKGVQRLAVENGVQ